MTQDEARGSGREGASAPDEADLAGWMAAYQGGDVSAFERLYEAIAPQLRGYLRSLARDAVRADDLVQETFLQVHRARRTYQPGRPLRPWLYAIARNVFLMSRRSASRRERHEIVPEVELPEHPAESGIEHIVARESLAHAVGVLGAERCEALLLHHLAGLSFREVGAVLGISEGAAKVRAHRAMNEVRDVLTRERGSGGT